MMHLLLIRAIDNVHGQWIALDSHGQIQNLTLISNLVFSFSVRLISIFARDVESFWLF